MDRERRSPNWLILVSAIVTLPLIAFAWNTWPETTLERFRKLIRAGEFAAAREMIDFSYFPGSVLDDRGLALAAKQQLPTNPRSAWDRVLGRADTEATLAYANDYSIQAVRGRIILGGAFYNHYFPRGPIFHLSPTVENTAQQPQKGLVD